MTQKRKYESARQLERQSHIIETARRLLEEEGYEGMTMRGLAKQAGVAQGTLYNLYSSKDELVLAAINYVLEELGEKAIAMVDGKHGLDAVLALTEVTGEQVQATPNYADAMTRTLFRGQQDDPLVDVLFARSYPLVLAHLRYAEQQHEIVPGTDLDMLARHLVGQGWGVMMLWLMGMVVTADVVTERLRSELMTLIGVTQGPAQERLRQRLAELPAGAPLAQRQVS